VRWPGGSSVVGGTGGAGALKSGGRLQETQGLLKSGFDASWNYMPVSMGQIKTHGETQGLGSVHRPFCKSIDAAWNPASHTPTTHSGINLSDCSYSRPD
jgi:hypothetical protein